MTFQHPTPYYDDSYAVNSANIGPYGDALTYELIPYVEEQFRGQGGVFRPAPIVFVPALILTMMSGERFSPAANLSVRGHAIPETCIAV